MIRPISAGDVCEIIKTFTGRQSPNLGLRVAVGRRIYGAHGMDHSRFGPIHEISGAGICQMSDSGAYVVTGRADIPVAWLRRIEPDAPPAKTKTLELEV